MTLEEEYEASCSVKHRKQFSQFFTPESIAHIMVDWVLGKNDVKTILEPAFGTGIFTRLFLQSRSNVKITGFDIDSNIFNFLKNSGPYLDGIDLQLEDYLFNDWDNKYDAIICNPPYSKFHNYPNKEAIKIVNKKLGSKLSGFTNLYGLFLLKSIYQLKEGGRIAYIVPSDFLNSNYGVEIKKYLLNQNVLRHIFLFDYKENVFGNAVTTTSAILLLSKDSNNQAIHFSVINTKNKLKDISCVIDSYPKKDGEFTYKPTEISPEIKWRAYYQNQESKNFKNLVPFSNFAKVVRGIATGANNYFIFNKSKAKEFNISKRYLLHCVTKSKDIYSPIFTYENCKTLEDSDDNIYIFNGVLGLNNDSVLNYVKTGETEGVNKKHLPSKRTPWFSIENRDIAPIWVGVFNRNKNIKFIRNEAKIRNLTAFHCVYFSGYKDVGIDLFFAYLMTEVAHKILGDNRREYGRGLNQFQPNDLNHALMLDISILSVKNKEDIKLLYKNYRDSLLSGYENKKYIDNINEILVKEFT